MPTTLSSGWYEELQVHIPSVKGQQEGIYQHLIYRSKFNIPSTSETSVMHIPLYCKTGTFRSSEYIQLQPILYSYTKWACRHSATKNYPKILVNLSNTGETFG